MRRTMNSGTNRCGAVAAIGVPKRVCIYYHINDACLDICRILRVVCSDLGIGPMRRM